MAETESTETTRKSRPSQKNYRPNSYRGRGTYQNYQESKSVAKALHNFGVRDLRELLDKKHQDDDQKSVCGPPPDPSYNFLKDPMRDSIYKDRAQKVETLNMFPPKVRSRSVEVNRQIDKPSFIQNPANIRVIFTITTGERNCKLDENKRIPNIRRVPDHRYADKDNIPRTTRDDISIGQYRSKENTQRRGGGYKGRDALFRGRGNFRRGRSTENRNRDDANITSDMQSRESRQRGRGGNIGRGRSFYSRRGSSKKMCETKTDLEISCENWDNEVTGQKQEIGEADDKKLHEVSKLKEKESSIEENELGRKGTEYSIEGDPGSKYFVEKKGSQSNKAEFSINQEQEIKEAEYSANERKHKVKEINSFLEKHKNKEPELTAEKKEEAITEEHENVECKKLTIVSSVVDEKRTVRFDISSSDDHNVSTSKDNKETKNEE